MFSSHPQFSSGDTGRTSAAAQRNRGHQGTSRLVPKRNSHSADLGTGVARRLSQFALSFGSSLGGAAVERCYLGIPNHARYTLASFLFLCAHPIQLILFWSLLGFAGVLATTLFARRELSSELRGATEGSSADPSVIVSPAGGRYTGASP